MRLGVLKGGMEGSTGRRGSAKWQWESVREQWGSIKALKGAEEALKGMGGIKGRVRCVQL